MPIVIVQKKVIPAAAVSGGFTVSFDAPTVAGNFLVASLSWSNSAATRTPPIMSGWTLAVESTTPSGVVGTMRSSIFYLKSAPSTTSATFLGGGAGLGNVTLYELSGVDESVAPILGTRVGTTASNSTFIQIGTTADTYPDGGATIYSGTCDRAGSGGWTTWDVSETTPETEDGDIFVTSGYNAGFASRSGPFLNGTLNCGSNTGFNVTRWVSSVAMGLKAAPASADGGSSTFYGSD